MVLAAIAVGLIGAVTVRLPADVPAVALQAAVVYRVEVGAAVFVGLYGATMAFALALQNRGFTEIGSGGIRARGLAADVVDEGHEMELVLELTDEVRDLRAWRERSEYVR